MAKTIEFLNGCKLTFDGAHLILADSTGTTCDIDASAQDILRKIALYKKFRKYRNNPNNKFYLIDGVLRRITDAIPFDDPADGLAFVEYKNNGRTRT